MIVKCITKIKSWLAVASFGYGVGDKLLLMVQQVRIAAGAGSPYSVMLSIGTGAKARLHLEGTYDELAMLGEIFVGECYATSAQAVKTILDLGANIGIAAVWFSLKYPNAVIHCYEPSEQPRVLLRKNLPPCVRIFPLAIATHEGPLEMNMSERSVESSSAFNFPHMKQVMVQATTLDQAIQDIGGSVDVVKMDIEGAEFDVLASSQLLAQIREIVGEVHPAFAGRTIDEMRRSLAKTHLVTIPESPSKSVDFYAVRK